MSAEPEGWVPEVLAPLGNLLALDGFLEGAPPVEQSGAILRREVLAFLERGPFRIQPPWLTDALVAESGIDFAQALDEETLVHLAELLDVDGLLVGDVLSWERGYHLVQSTQTVALAIRCVDRASGAVAYDARHVVRVGAGLTGGPTGWISLLTAPLEGLRDALRSELAIAVAQDAAHRLVGS